MTETFLHLSGRHTSVVIDLSRRDFPVWRHWGAKLTDTILAPTFDAAAPVPSFSLDENVPLGVMPLFGDGWHGPSALLAHRGGKAWAQGAQRYTVERHETGAVLSLIDEVAGITLTQHLTLDPASDVLTLSTTVRNDGTDSLEIAWLAAGVVPLPARAAVVKSLSGRHNHEFVDVETPLTRSGWRRENRTGLTSHDCPPCATVLARDAAAVWSGQLAWSGNSVQSIDWLDDGRWLWMAGEWLAPGEVSLAPGHSLASRRCADLPSRDP